MFIIFLYNESLTLNITQNQTLINKFPSFKDVFILISNTKSNFKKLPKDAFGNTHFISNCGFQ
jgi:hypothetical protein